MKQATNQKLRKFETKENSPVPIKYDEEDYGELNFDPNTIKFKVVNS